MKARAVLVRLAVEVGIVAAVAVMNYLVERLGERVKERHTQEPIDVEPIVKPAQ